MGGDVGPLVTDAAIVRLDVYGPLGHCAAGQLAPGSGAPFMSRSYMQGQAIMLDVPPGKHALVLTTYSDDAATHPLGQGCTEDDFTACPPLCFDLAVTAG